MWFEDGIRYLGLPRWHSGNCQWRRCKRCGFDPWMGKIPSSRKWQSAPVFLPGKFYGQRIPLGSVHGVKRVRHDWTRTHFTIWQRIHKDCIYNISVPVMLLLLEKHFITTIDIHLERNCLDKKFLSLKSSGEKKKSSGGQGFYPLLCSWFTTTHTIIRPLTQELEN